MAATAADIAAAGRDGAVATWTDAAITARYPSARDGSVSPSVGYFDAIADALTVINARGNLIGVERRRFVPLIADLVWPDLSAGIPQDQLIDAEQAVNAGFLGARVEVDLDAETTTHELFG
jgi:hypothetical protein